MSTLVGGTGIIGQDIFCSFGTGKYTEMKKGTEINIENCVKARMKDLVVEGKTYQNLTDKVTLYRGTVNYDKNLSTIRVSSNDFSLPIGTYTILVTDSTFQIAVYPHYETTNSTFIFWTNKIIWHNDSETNNPKFTVRKKDQSNITVDEVIGKVILLEGDHTDTDLPTSIDGIESVAEKEENVLSVKVNENITNINLPIPIRSLPNGVVDTIEGDKLVQRVGKVVLNGTQAMTLANVNQTETTRIRIPMDNAEISLNKNNLICDWYIRTGAHGDYEYIIIQDSSAGICLFISVLNSKLETADLNGIEKYFKENPLTVYYELAKPIIHELTIPNISTAKGTNIITTSNNIKPKLSMKVKVK